MITYELISNEVEKKMPKGIVFRVNNKQNWRNARIPYPFVWGTNLPVVKFPDTGEKIIAHQIRVPFEKPFVFKFNTLLKQDVTQRLPLVFSEKNEATFAHPIELKFVKED